MALVSALDFRTRQDDDSQEPTTAIVQKNELNLQGFSTHTINYLPLGLSASKHPYEQQNTASADQLCDNAGQECSDEHHCGKRLFPSIQCR